MRFQLNQEHISGRIRALVPAGIHIPVAHSYHRSYGHMLSLFQGRALDQAVFVQGAHMVYGWMPTILEIDPEGIDDAIQILETLRTPNDSPLTSDDWLRLKRLVNNSLVGASKLAHFVAPDRVAIWDSNIIKYLVMNNASIGSAALQSRAGSISQFVAYQSAMRAARDRPAAIAARNYVSERLGYHVSQMRAVELLMFHA